MYTKHSSLFYINGSRDELQKKKKVVLIVYFGCTKGRAVDVNNHIILCLFFLYLWNKHLYNWKIDLLEIKVCWSFSLASSGKKW